MFGKNKNEELDELENNGSSLALSPKIVQTRQSAGKQRSVGGSYIFNTG